jgi:hypothetical protein
MIGDSPLSSALFGFLPKLFRRPEPVVDRRSLQVFMDRRAAFIAQKGIVEFCRVRAGVYWQKLFAEEEFRSVLNMSCWLAYSPALALVTEMVEAALRPAAGANRPQVADALEQMARDVYFAYPTPQGLSEAQWRDRFAIVGERLAEATGRAAQPVRKMPEGLSRLVFEALPIHPNIVRNDADYIHNNIRMNLLRAHDDFLSVADLPRLADALGGSRQALQ